MMASNTIEISAEIVNLDGLNVKQKTKEFKVTQKDIKSKELPIKIAAIAKCQDRRYISEGLCLPPLILSIVPKKKNLEYAKISFEKLCSIIDVPISIEPTTLDNSSILTAFNIHYRDFNNLDFLKMVSDSIIFKEEIKKIKKPKGKKKDQILLEEVPPVVMNPDYKAIRTFALKSLYKFMLNLYNASDTDFINLKISFATIENLYSNLFSVLSDIEDDLDKNPKQPISSDCSLQMAIYALMTLVFVLRYNSDAVDSFISNCSTTSQAEDVEIAMNENDITTAPSKSILSIIQNLSTINGLTHYCLQILQIISKTNSGLELLTSQENKEHLLLLLDISKHVLEYSAAPIIQPEYLVFKGEQENEYHKYLKKVGNCHNLWYFATELGEERLYGTKVVETPAPVATKGGKDDKKKKDDKTAAPPPEPVDPLEQLDRVKIDLKRSSACSIRIISLIFTKIANLQKESVSDTVVTVLSDRLSSLLINKKLWEVIREPLSFPLDESIDDVLEEICILLGSLGSVSIDIRKLMVQNKVLTSVLTFIELSLTVVSGISLEVETSPPEKTTKPGKGAPAVVTPIAPPLIELNNSQSLQLNRLRRISEQVILILIATTEKVIDENAVVTFENNRWNSGSKYVTSIDILNLTGSDIYVNRIVHMIAVLNDNDLSNRSSRILAAILVGLENPLGYIIQNGLESNLLDKISKVINERGLSIVDYLTSESNPAEPTNELVESKVDEIETKVEDLQSSEATIAAKNSVDLLIPNTTEAFYYMSVIVEILLASSSVENNNVFGTIDRVKTLVSLLKLLGPCSNNVKSDSTGLKEFQVILYDPRLYTWRSDEAESVSDIIYLRPILIDILSLIASADFKSRKFEGDLPAETLKPLPVSKSHCEEASLTVCKYASDIVYAILSNQTKLTTCGDNIVAVPAPDEYKLPVSVLHASLRLVRAISSCGPIGLAASVDAIADSGFKESTHQQVDRFDSKNIYSMKLLDWFIHITIGQDINATMPTGWKRPLFFDEVYKSNDFLTTLQSIGTASSLWPFIVISSSLIPLISDPSNSKESSFLAIEAIKSLVQFVHQSHHSQPVLSDILATTFISLGGGVALTGIIGRFGNIADENREYVKTFISYLLQRGKCRKEFWHKWAEDHKEVVVLDPKTGKPIPKKEDKKAAPAKVEKKDPKAVPPVQIIPEIVWHLESTEAVPDPNHGPDINLWINILNIKCDDLYEKCTSASLLTSAIQGCQSDLAVELIELGVDVNQSDGSGLSPIMYAICLSNIIIAEHLVANHADVNALDKDRNPVIKYALLSISSNDIDSFLPGYMPSTYNQNEVIKVFGSPSILNVLLDSKVDYNVCDTNGYNPLLMAMGLGRMTVVIGGYAIDILSSAYNNVNYEIDLIHSVVTTLLDLDCSVNFCSTDGVIPMHIAAARGDFVLINIFALRESVINAVDSRGLIPLHYLSIAAPSNCIEVFDALMELSVNRPLDRMIFDDYRTGQSEEYKDQVEGNRFVKKHFTSALSPESIGKLRLVYSELIHTVTDDGMNILQLCMSSGNIFKSHPLFSPLLFGDKDLRMSFSLHLIASVDKIDNGINLISNIDTQGFSVLHSATILFKGITPKRELTDREKRSKRVKTYPSKEVNIIEVILSNPNVNVNELCFRTIDNIGVSPWDALHAAIQNDNPDMMTYLFDNGFDISNGQKYLNFLIQSKTNHSIDCIKLLVNKLSESPNYKNYLNESDSNDIRRPLLMAVRNKKIDVINILVNNPKVDLNVIDEISNITAFHEACLTGSIELINTFRPATPRIDLLATGRKNNCIIDIIESKNIELLLELISMRKNDVIETILTESNEESSYLIKLEEENIKLAKLLGYNLPSDNNNNNNNEESPITDEEGNELERIVSIEEVQKSFENIKISDLSPAIEDYYPSEETKGENIDEKSIKDITEESIINIEECNDKFKASNNLLKVLIDLVNSTGIITESHHAHKIFFDGNLIIDNTNY